MKKEICGENTVSSDMNVVNVRRTISMLRESCVKFATDRIPDANIIHLSEGFDTVVQNFIDRKCIVSGYTVVQKVVGRCRTYAGRNYVLLVWDTLDSKGVSGTAQKVLHMSIRRAKLFFKRKVQNVIICDIIVKPVPPVTPITTKYLNQINTDAD